VRTESDQLNIGSTQSKLPLLSKLIERKIKIRVAVAILFLVSSAFVASFLQIRSSFSSFELQMKKTAQDLSEQVISEILVHNTQSIEMILQNAERNSQIPWKIEFNQESSLPIEKGVRISPKLSWGYDFALTGFGNSEHGTLHFSGRLFELPFVVDEVLFRGFPLFLIAVVIFFILIPFVKKIPEQLIENPVRDILSSIRGVSNEQKPEIEDAHFQEIYSIKSGIFDLIQRNKALEDERVLLERDRAVASMTQMVAHDVRKPFSMLQASLQMIQQCKNHSELKVITQEFIPEINRAMSSVNGLLQDVMEVSSKAEAHLEQVRPESLIETTLVDLFSMQDESLVALEYSLKHGKTIKADAQKLMRVFLNICGNAVQAMNNKGTLRFETKDFFENGVSYVEFSILNTGSFIAEEDLKSLFDAFFTKNKKGGTGLGLAIAKKVVTAHGGKISCRSQKDSIHPQGFVEFIFTIPAGDVLISGGTESLPVHSSDLRSKMRKLESGDESESGKAIGIQELEQRVLEVLKTTDRKLNILMVDDEQVYKPKSRHCGTHQDDLCFE
jgi:signal transduction histidine kinase